MRHFALNVSLMVALVSVSACGGDMDEAMGSDMSPEGIISNALSAGPTSITGEAAVLDWALAKRAKLRQGRPLSPGFLSFPLTLIKYSTFVLER